MKLVSKLVSKISKSFIKGLSILLPFGLTIFITFYSIQKINNIIYHIFYFIPILSEIVTIPGVGILLTFLFITILGYAGSTFLISKIILGSENILLNIPIINFVYSYIKESTSAFIDKFNRPVLVLLDKKDSTYKVGFLTQENLHSLTLSSDEVIVYLPHSYSFSGELTIFPRKSVRELNIPGPEAMRLIVTGGLAKIKTPKSLPKPSKKPKK